MEKHFLHIGEHQKATQYIHRQSFVFSLPRLIVLGIIWCLTNWEKMPQTLFAKAWVTTGHVSMQRSMEISGLSEQEMSECHLLTDPLSLESVLGAGNEEGPSLEDLISGGRAKRRRVVWMMDNKNGSGTAQMPGSLIMPIEKHLANFLFSSLPDKQQSKKPEKQMKEVVTIVMSKKYGREASHEVQRKHTILHASGLKGLSRSCPSRTAKDRCLYNILKIVYCRWRNF